MSETKLKPCPFCGGKAYIGDNGYEEPIRDEKGYYIDMDIYQPDIFFVACNECGAMIGGEDTEEDAISTWNTRKPVDDVMEQLKENAFPDLEEEYSCDGQQMLFLSDAIEIVKEVMGHDG